MPQVIYLEIGVLGLNIRMHKPNQLKTLQNVLALLSIGLTSYPGLVIKPGNYPHHPHKTVATAQARPAEPERWIRVKATSYSWQEPDHVRYGKSNCMGGDLTQLVQGMHQCAADLQCYPLGSILCIKTDEGEETRIVTDCGKDVQGPHHIDLHFDSLVEMNAWATRNAQIQVVRLGWHGKLSK